MGTRDTVWSRSRYIRRPGSLSTRLGIVLRWPIGLVLISWRYLWRITPVYRREEDGGPDDLPPPIPDSVETDDVQGLADGYGPLLHRRYAVRVVGSRSTPEQVVALLAADPNSAAPQDAAVFVKSKAAAVAGRRPGAHAPRRRRGRSPRVISSVETELILRAESGQIWRP